MRARRAGSLRADPMRLMMALALVAAVIAVLWLWGRPRNQTFESVAVTTQFWPQASEPADIAFVSVPSELAGRFVEPQELVGLVAATDIPAGVYLTASHLVEPGSLSSGDSDSTLMSFSADLGSWGGAAPKPGDWAVVATAPGRCALRVLRISELTEGVVAFAVKADLARDLAQAASQGDLVLWRSPVSGWPSCSGGIAAPVAEKSRAADGAGSAGVGGSGSGGGIRSGAGS